MGNQCNKIGVIDGVTIRSYLGNADLLPLRCLILYLSIHRIYPPKVMCCQPKPVPPQTVPFTPAITAEAQVLDAALPWALASASSLR